MKWQKNILALYAVAMGGIIALSTYISLLKIPPPEVVTIPAGEYSYRLPGRFRIDTRRVDAPLRHQTAPALHIMKYQVSQGQYGLCVRAGACVGAHGVDGVDFAQVHINYHDAGAYAAWLSEQTGQHWRLPTAFEWQRAAGDMYFDGALGDLDDANDPAKRWILEYTRQVELARNADMKRYVLGTNGANSLGLFDVSANVWEWTDTCFASANLDADGQTILNRVENCAARVVAGRHTAYIVEFVRDANVGGCAAGIPPDYLGFRLVLDEA